MLLEDEGHQVISVFGFNDSLAKCNRGDFDVFIRGHSIPHADKLELVTTFRTHCRAPIISLRRVGEEITHGADFYIEPEPERLLRCVTDALKEKR